MFSRCAFSLALLLVAANVVRAVADEPTLPVEIEPAFTGVTWQGWQAINDDGLNVPFRPIVITHGNDESGRLFVAEQHGTIHVIDNHQNVQTSRLLLDITDQVRYADKENEEGFLGLAFHPKFAENGQFFVYYTPNSMPRESVVSRFKVSADNPDKADPKSEEIILRIPQVNWNHNGGTITFGPDGYLYIGMGDGGGRNDPERTAQDMKSLLGKILRIDVDRKSADKPYSIPDDNPFVGQSGVRPEIYAYGLRNVWRMAFDPKTDLLWCADVGQDKWEEINLIEKGGNYGWSAREGKQPFNADQAKPNAKYLDPIFEYDHEVGKSITGGLVYRGKQVPELVGKYVYADYVTGKIWALDYDTDSGKVRANYRIPSPMLPVITFGDDEAGEVYFAIVAQDGKGLFRFRSGSILPSSQRIR
jgi:glucose/arabinose dehydrogenase